MNGGETDIDCGGAGCAACGDGGRCSVNGVCKVPSCARTAAVVCTDATTAGCQSDGANGFADACAGLTDSSACLAVDADTNGATADCTYTTTAGSAPSRRARSESGRRTRTRTTTSSAGSSCPAPAPPRSAPPARTARRTALRRMWSAAASTVRRTASSTRAVRRTATDRTGRDLTTKLCRALTASESCTAADNTNSPIHNFWEADVDCGGPDCRALGNACALTEKCLVDADCASGQCRER